MTTVCNNVATIKSEIFERMLHEIMRKILHSQQATLARTASTALYNYSGVQERTGSNLQLEMYNDS